MFLRLGHPANGIARGRLRSVQLEVMDEISRDSLAGSNFTKGKRRGVSAGNKVLKKNFLWLLSFLEKGKI